MTSFFLQYSPIKSFGSQLNSLSFLKYILPFVFIWNLALSIGSDLTKETKNLAKCEILETEMPQENDIENEDEIKFLATKHLEIAIFCFQQFSVSQNNNNVFLAKNKLCTPPPECA